jgi:hypothetical protein
MRLIHRFSARTVNTPTRLFAEDKLRSYIIKEQKHTDRKDADDLIKVIMSKQSTIKEALRPIGMEVRERGGIEKIVGDDLEAAQKWWNRALLKTYTVPVSKLYIHNNFTLALYEEPSKGSRNGHRLVLSIEAHDSVRILAASDEAVKVKGGEIKLKQRNAPMS